LQDIISVATHKREVLVDITEQVRQVVTTSGIKDGIGSVYVQRATAAMMIQESWDQSVQTDAVNFLPQIISKGV
jgi:secondary thiamine-phosphate synthase enzyme